VFADIGKQRLQVKSHDDRESAGKPRRLFLPVNDARIEDALADDADLISVKLSEEAALIALVARGPTALANLEEDRVGVAVDEDRLDVLHVAAFLALAPQSLAATAIIARESSPDCLFERLLVHPGEHQDFTRLHVLGDHGDEAVQLFEIRLQCPRLPGSKSIHSIS
jgi:hypothetical protein